ncbi:MAG: ABC transporter ATP-binding protein [Candidatus Methylomirabilia bacterium]
MLKLNNVEVVYDRAILVLRGVSFEVPDRQIVTLLGSNGAGKSTVLKAVSGILKPERGEVTTGSVEFKGPNGWMRIEYREPEKIVGMGIALVMEGRRVFEHLTTEENLLAGAHTRRDLRAIRQDLELVYGYFPKLANRRAATAGYLSGGEQQMLAIGRGLMSRPKVMLLDEPSLGLAPMLVEEIFAIVQRLNQDEGVTVLLVEQNAAMALTIAQHGYIMENGRIVLDGAAETLQNNEDIKEFYLGLSEVGARKSYRDIKHYRRRKRWLS